MIRGTTPVLGFDLPFSTDLLAEAYVTFAQLGKVVLDKPLSACSKSDTKLIVRLTQEETLKLTGNCNTEIQVRVRTTSGDALASQIIPVETCRVLKEGVI